MSRHVFGFLTFLLLLGPVSASEEQPRKEWVLDDSYQGAHQASFNKLRHEVPVLMRQTMIDLAVRCGLRFEEGWSFPMVVRFDESAPFGAENALAYVRMEQNEQGDIRQSLVINLDAYDRETSIFSKVFAHELVHAMLNDSMGVNSMKLPVWFHEGLAVYGANQGEQVMQSYVERFPSGSSSPLLNGLDGGHGALDYLEDYLAFKYVHDKLGVNKLHNLIREVINRGGDIPGAVKYTCFESWEEFQANARQFAEEEISRVERSLRANQSSTRPY